MATKPLKSIQFPGLDDPYTIPQVDTTLTVTGAAADAKKTGDEIAELKNDLTDMDGKIAASLITNTVSGSIVSFPDGADGVPVKDLVAQITPVQNLHGLANPYPGGGWKNLLEITITTRTIAGVTITVNSDGSIFMHGTATDIIYVPINSDFDSTALAGKKFKCNYVTGVSYRVTSASSFDALQSLTSDGTENTIADNGTGLRFVMRINNGTVLSNTAVSPRIGVDSAAIESWTPYANICPITGWIGMNAVRSKNQYVKAPSDVVVRYGLTSVPNSEDNSVRIYGYSSGGGCPLCGSFSVQKETTIKVVNIPTITTTLGNYYLWDSTANAQLGANFYESGFSATIPANHEIVFAIYIRWTRSVDMVFKPRIVDVDTYETISITFPTEAGTVYGGTLDVTTGVLTVTMAEVDMGTLSWVKDENSSNVFYHIKTTEEKAVPCISSNYPRVTGPYNPWSSMPDKSLYSTTGYWIIKDTSYTDAQSLTTALDGAQLVYNIATPVTVQLTPEQLTTLLGLNNIWADCGDVEVDYRADTKLYIENLTAPTEDDMVANTNIPDATYFMIGNTLYLSTTTIPAGDTINPGTNCTKMDLAAALNAINA